MAIYSFLKYDGRFYKTIDRSPALIVDLNLDQLLISKKKIYTPKVANFAVFLVRNFAEITWDTFPSRYGSVTQMKTFELKFLWKQLESVEDL